MNKHLVLFASCAAYKPEPGSPSEASGGGWFQTFPPYGRYPVGGTIEGAAKDAEYVFDEKTAKNIIDHFRAAAKKADWPGILVDREHYSLDPKKPSDAMAWAKDIRQEADGSLWTRWEFTPQGRELWNGKILVNRSPAFLAEQDGKEYRPFELKSIGMTNVPHFEELSTLAAARKRRQEMKHEKLTGAQMCARCKNWGLIRELAAVCSDGYFDESKHPRAEDGKFTDGAGGSTEGGKKTKDQKSTESFKRRMDEEGEVTELNNLELKYHKLMNGDPFNLSPEAEKALDEFTKKKTDLQRRGLIEERIRGAKPGEGFKHKSTTDAMKRSPKVNMGDGHSSWTEEERKRFADPTSHMKWTSLVSELASKYE